MKNGFTLIELLGVITILGIVAVITVPIFDSSINENKQSLYNTQLNQIIKGAKSYYSEHLNELPQTTGDENGVKIKLGDLQSEGYLPSDIENPITNEPFGPEELSVRVIRIGENQFEYEIIENN